MKYKDQVFDVFLKWKAMVENQIGKKVKVPRLDNGGEYTCDPFKDFCQQESIVRHFTVKGTPQQNEIAKRMNLTLL